LELSPTKIKEIKPLREGAEKEHVQKNLAKASFLRIAGEEFEGVDLLGWQESAHRS
jgi:hypothetical protein